jgi:hypothetical protein
VCIQGPGLLHILQSALDINTTAFEFERLLTLPQCQHETGVNHTSHLPLRRQSCLSMHRSQSSLSTMTQQGVLVLRASGTFSVRSVFLVRLVSGNTIRVASSQHQQHRGRLRNARARQHR